MFERKIREKEDKKEDKLSLNIKTKYTHLQDSVNTTRSYVFSLFNEINLF